MRQIVVAENSMAGDGINAVTVTVETFQGRRPPFWTGNLRATDQPLLSTSLRMKRARTPLQSSGG
jgi:hypothetical protein